MILTNIYIIFLLVVHTRSVPRPLVIVNTASRSCCCCCNVLLLNQLNASQANLLGHGAWQKGVGIKRFWLQGMAMWPWV